MQTLRALTIKEQVALEETVTLRKDNHVLDL
jgi:hypothetical protein